MITVVVKFMITILVQCLLFISPYRKRNMCCQYVYLFKKKIIHYEKKI